MNNIIMAILLCQIYVQSVEYILDDQTINSDQVCGRIVHLHYPLQLQEGGCG